MHGFDAWLALGAKDGEEAECSRDIAGVLPAARLLVEQLRVVR